MAISRRDLLEIAGIFAIFALQGAWPLPHVNEPNYLGKAVHFWNHHWAAGDFFLETADTHLVFYWTFGWLSRWLSLPALAWTGRLLTWVLLAWGWQRLSTAVVPRPWFSLLSAGLVAMLGERFNMADEWVFGGVEGKGFAYVLVFFALAAILRGRWNWGWILLGAASAFHVLVGGWAALAMGVAWLMLGRQRPRLVSLLPGLALAVVLCLPGLIPALQANRGTDAETIDKANTYYVYFRLWHHLDPLQIAQNTPYYALRFVALCIGWLILWRSTCNEVRLRPLAGFVNAALLFALAGVAVDLWQFRDEALAAKLLRFYWFRLPDVAVPLGVALVGTWFVAQSRQTAGNGPDRRWLTVAAALVVFHLGALCERRVQGIPKFVDQGGCNPAWRKACDWVAESGQIAPNARFITPMMSQTFKWYTGRPEVVNWKELPQDAASIVEWLDRLQKLFGKDTLADNPDDQWYRSLADRNPADVRRLAAHYEADYVLTFCDPLLPLPVVYKNAYYVIYRMGPHGGNPISDAHQVGHER